MRIRALGLVAAALWGVGASSVRAQDPLTAVTPATQVRSIEFAFPEDHEVKEGDLRALLATQTRPKLRGLRNALSWLPMIQPVEKHLFQPIELQRDAVRLRQFYRRQGFLQASITYQVRYNATEDLVSITFVVREGPPLKIAAIEFSGLDSGTPRLDPHLAEEWARFTARERNRTDRWSDQRQRELTDSTARWLGNRGYAFAGATTMVSVDTPRAQVRATVLVKPGRRGRIGEITVTGNHSMPGHDLRRLLPVKPGDWYNAARLEEGRQRLMQFDVIRLARIQIPPDTARDSVDISLQVVENDRYLIQGELGWSSETGIAGRADWTHRSLGGLRTLTFSAIAQTGLFPLQSQANKEYRFTVSLFQPYVGDRRLSFAGGPFAEYRDDYRDRSWRAGAQGTLAWATNPLRTVSLGYTGAYRRVLEFGFGNITVGQYLQLFGLPVSDSVGQLPANFESSVLTLSGTWGRLDRYANPRKGYVLRPRVAITTPFLNTVEYALLDLTATFFLPLRHASGITIRGAGGRIVPFGSGVPAPGTTPLEALLDLHDAAFTAGGTRDVRGWGPDLLGAKLPKVEQQTENGTATYIVEEYTPIGGLARLLASAQVNVPLPGLEEQWQAFAFVDGARVWSPDRRYEFGDPALVQRDFYFSTGGGFGYTTLIGAVVVALGYKLNPSALDLRDPADVMNALTSGRPIEEVPTDSRRRFQLHFSIGATF